MKQTSSPKSRFTATPQRTPFWPFALCMLFLLCAVAVKLYAWVNLNEFSLWLIRASIAMDQHLFNVFPFALPAWLLLAFFSLIYLELKKK